MDILYGGPMPSIEQARPTLGRPGSWLPPRPLPTEEPPLKPSWNLNRLRDGKRRVRTVDLHTAGEPLRVVLEGLPTLSAKSILGKRKQLAQCDTWRTQLMHEPRGHGDMYGCVVTEAATTDGDFGVLFLHNEGYSTMCGHGIIAVVTALIECGGLQASTGSPIRIDTPAGRVTARAQLTPAGRVEAVSFVNVPSFVAHFARSLTTPSFGKIPVDVAFGGAFYAILPAQQLSLTVGGSRTSELVTAAHEIKQCVMEQFEIRHPQQPELGYLYGVILTDSPEDPRHHSRNLCVFANDQVDRSPTGTGVSARLALHFARAEIAMGEWIAIESILGARSVFKGRVLEVDHRDGQAGVLPEITGSAFVTGIHEFLLDDKDPLRDGFLLP